MRHYGKLRYSRHWLPRTLGAAALAAGLLTAGWPAGTALASPTAAGSTSYFFTASTSIKALGRTWSFDLSVTKGSGIDGIVAGLDTVSKGVIESHEWGSTAAFGPTAAKELTVTGSGHAAVKTGSALSPVLAASPERGRTCPSNLSGMAIDSPVGIFALPSGASVTGASIAACRSIPEAPRVW